MILKFILYSLFCLQSTLYPPQYMHMISTDTGHYFKEY